MKTLKIYTDGAYSGNKQVGGWAFYIPDVNVRVIGNEANTTINRMELTAAIEALKFVINKKLNVIVEIYSDSMYLVGGMELGWNKEINNDLWKKLDFFKSVLNVTFIHVSGHSGISENEIADKLAVKASQLEI